MILAWELAYAKGYELQVANVSRSTRGSFDSGETSTRMVPWMTFYNTTSGQGHTEVVSGFAPVVGTDYRVYCYERFQGSPWGFSLYELELFNTGA